MPYLIDGHNLIGQLPTIRLDDPDDEAKLVRLLQRFAMTRKVKVAVVFDRGYFGRQSLGGHGVAVRFARSPSDADEIIKNQLRAFAAPREWVLVSSDREIAAVAREVGANVITARDFAETLGAMGAADPASAERAEAHAHVRGDKVGEWLDLFGVDAEEASKPIDLQRKPEPPPAPQAARTAARTGTLPKKKPAQPKPPVVPRTPPRRWEE
ncbi:MAG TPA: NYN domain-containing protein, partial [Herpetosiphonaceae bacterium]